MTDPFRDHSSKRQSPNGKRAAAAAGHKFTVEQDTAADLLREQFVKVEQDIGARQAELAELGDQLRPDPNNAELRERIQRLKREIAPLYDEHAELARAISRILGGKQHTPPV